MLVSRERAVARDAHDRRKDVVLGELARPRALAAALDELRIGPAEPGDGDLPLGREDREQVLPLALIAAEAPALDQFGAGLFVVDVHCMMLS